MNENEITSGAPPAEEMKKCPFCAEMVKAEAIKCRYCGSMLCDPATDAQPAQPSPPPLGPDLGPAPGACPPPPQYTHRADPLREEWYRKLEGKLIGGVCSGMAEHFDISVSLLRLAFVLAVLLGFGTGVLIYLVLWIILPVKHR